VAVLFPSNLVHEPLVVLVRRGDHGETRPAVVPRVLTRIHDNPAPTVKRGEGNGAVVFFHPRLRVVTPSPRVSQQNSIFIRPGNNQPIREKRVRRGAASQRASCEVLVGVWQKVARVQGSTD
jgi:hypothetical protein